MGAGLNSSAFDVSVAVEAASVGVPIDIDTKILTNDITIDSEFLNGDSGLLRFGWSFTTGADYAITFTKLGAADLTGFPLIVNGDNSFVLRNNGHYRFDIMVKPGDIINLSSSVAITQINDFQVQRVQIAA